MAQTTMDALAAEVGELLTVAEAAAIARVSPPTIYKAIDAGEIAGVIRVSARGTRIPAASFRDFLHRRLVAANP